jgi:hypothetical protein
MNKGRLIWGLICVALAILNMVLPKESIMFNVEGQNVPWVPPLVLGIVGIVLLATAWWGGGEAEESAEGAAPAPVQDPRKAALSKRLETIAWGLFLIMLGGFLFVPEELISGGWWPIGVGLIMLGLNAARYANGIKMSGFTTVLGIISVIGGVLELVALKRIEGALLIIILGLYLVVKPWIEERKLFGKAEES